MEGGDEAKRRDETNGRSNAEPDVCLDNSLAAYRTVGECLQYDPLKEVINHRQRTDN